MLTSARTDLVSLKAGLAEAKAKQQINAKMATFPILFRKMSELLF